MDKMSFAEWLQNELTERDMSQSELARLAGINRQVISTYINQKRIKPDENILRAIARAFRVPNETVFRAAGMLDPVSEVDEEVAKLLNDFRQLPERDRAEIQALIDFKLQQVKLEIERQRAAHRNSAGTLPKMG